MASAEALVERICRSVTTFTGTAAQSDDITLTVLSWQPPNSGVEPGVRSGDCHRARPTSVNVRIESIGLTTVAIPEGRLDFGAAAGFQAQLEAGAGRRWI